MSKIFYLVIIVLMVLVAFGAIAQEDAEYTARQTAKAMSMIGAILLGLATLTGILFGLMGFFRMKATKDGRGGKEGGPFLLLLGIALTVLPWIYGAGAGWFTGEEVDINDVTTSVYGD